MSERYRKPKDRDFLRAQEGMLFCLTGYLHPPDRYTAYLKYSPTSEGKWEDATTAYRRELPYYHVRNVARTISHLEARHPAYVSHCRVRDFRFSMVPRDRVARYYAPQERLVEILDSPQDPLEEEVGGLALQICAETGVDSAALGITGSVLIGLHNPEFSDIDLTVYGLENAVKVRKALQESSISSVHRLDDRSVAKWSRGIAGRFPLTVEEARDFAGRRWNYGTYRARYFSIHPIRSDEEITEVYGERIYRGHGTARIRATVTVAREALFMPAIYEVEDVRLLEGDPAAAAVREIVSYEGLYRDVVDAHGLVEARGKLETVNGEPRRLVIGSMTLGGRGYIKPA